MIFPGKGNRGKKGLALLSRGGVSHQEDHTNKMR